MPFILLKNNNNKEAGRARYSCDYTCQFLKKRD